MDKVFQILAVVLAAAAIYFFWSDNRDLMFISGVLGCVMLFLSVRFQVKARNKIREKEAFTAADEKDA